MSPLRHATIQLPRALWIVVLTLLTLLTVGRMAMEAWSNRPAPGTLPEVGARTEVAAPFLLVVLDGLREGTSWLSADNPMPWMSDLAPEGTVGIALTGEPTLTAACVRTLLSGRRPDLLTGLRNFTARPVRGTIIEYLAARGGKTAHAGDAAAWQIARNAYPPGTEHVYQVPDRGPVDQGETDAVALPFALDQIERGRDVLTVHFTRIDHAGHKWGATGHEYADACRHVDGQLEQLITAFRARFPGATVLVASDHGVSAMGTHGGGEQEAQRAPYLLLGPDISSGQRVDLHQAALAPTISAALGLPQPPLADAPPHMALLTLDEEIKADARMAYVTARTLVAKSLGSKTVDRIEQRRAALDISRMRSDDSAWRALVRDVNRLMEPNRTIYAALALLLLWLGVATICHLSATPALDARMTRADALLSGGLFVGALLVLGLVPGVSSPWAAGIGAAGIVVSAWRARGPRPRTLGLVGACLAGVVALTATGYVCQEAFTQGDDVEVATQRLMIAGGLVLALLVLIVRPRRVLPRARHLVAHHPTAALALWGAPLGFLITLRPFLDNVVHTLVLYALFALVIVGMWYWGPRGRRVSAWGAGWVACVAFVLFVVVRLVEGLVLQGNWVQHTEPRSLLWSLAGICATGLALWVAPGGALASTCGARRSSSP